MKEINKLFKKSILLAFATASFALMANSSAHASSDGNRWYIAGAGGLVFKMKETTTYHVEPVVLKSRGWSIHSLIDDKHGHEYILDLKKTGEFTRICRFKDSNQSFAINDNTQASYNYDPGYNVSIAIGRTIACWRAELEAAYRRNHTKNITVTNNTGGAITITPKDHASNFALMANLYYDFYIAPCFSIYLGGGIGGSLYTAPYSGPHRPILFAWQIMIGTAYDLTHNFALTLGYRLLATTKRKQSDIDEGVTVNANKTPLSQGAEVGLRYKF